MTYAVVKIGGSQYKVREDDELAVEKLEGEKGKKIEFNQVLLVVTDDQAKIGRPFVKEVKVQAEIIEQFKGEKIRVATFRAKSRYRRVVGHRKHLTKIKILKIVFPKKPSKKIAPNR